MKNGKPLLPLFVVLLVVVSIILYWALVLKPKSELERKKYVAERRTDCFALYDKERQNWDNVMTSNYDEEKDKCYIVYKANQEELKNMDCTDLLPNISGKIDIHTLAKEVNDWQLCKDGMFKKEF